MVACTKTIGKNKQTKKKQQENKTPHQFHTATHLDFTLFWKLSGIQNQAHPQGISNEISVQPWELILPKPHFLFNCRSQGHFPIWILQMLLHILMSYTFCQILTIIFRATK